MAPLADFLLPLIPFSLPRHLYSYVPGQTPLSTTPSVVAALSSYLAIIFGVQAYMKDKQPKKLNSLFQAHNVFLSSGSLLLLVLMLEEIVPIAWNDGIFDAMCAEKSWTNVSTFSIERTSCSSTCRKWNFTTWSIIISNILNYLIRSSWCSRRSPLVCLLTKSMTCHVLTFNQLSFTSSITLRPHYYATLSWTEGPASWVVILSRCPVLIPPPVLGCHYLKPGSSCPNVYVKIPLFWGIMEDWFRMSPDYYYYATAGGAKIWVRVKIYSSCGSTL